MLERAVISSAGVTRRCLRETLRSQVRPPTASQGCFTMMATLAVAAGILGLFWLDRDTKARSSPVLWIPIFWLMIAASRNIGEWLHLGTAATQSDAYLDGNPVDRTILGTFELIGVVVLVQ